MRRARTYYIKSQGSTATLRLKWYGKFQVVWTDFYLQVEGVKQQDPGKPSIFLKRIDGVHKSVLPPAPVSVYLVEKEG